MKKLILIAIVLSLCTLHCAIAGEKNAEKKKKDPAYVEGVKYTFSFHPSYFNQSAMITLLDKEGAGKTIYRPNILGGVTIGMRYSFVNLSYTFPIPMSAQTEANYGPSDFTNINMGIMTRTFGMNAYFQRYKGFYRDESGSFYPLYNAPFAMEQRSDIETMSFGIFNHFIFSTGFSMKAAFESSEIQKKSKGAPMMLIAERVTRILADSNIVPFDQRQFFPDMNGMYKGFFNTIIIAPGFGYSFVAGAFSYTPVILMGTGLQMQSYKKEYITGAEKTKVGIKFPLYLNVKNSINFNTQAFFLRVVYGIEMNSFPIKKSAELKQTYLSGEICMGLRF